MRHSSFCIAIHSLMKFSVYWLIFIYKILFSTLMLTKRRRIRIIYSPVSRSKWQKGRSRPRLSTARLKFLMAPNSLRSRCMVSLLHSYGIFLINIFCHTFCSGRTEYIEIYLALRVGSPLCCHHAWSWVSLSQGQEPHQDCTCNCEETSRTQLLYNYKQPLNTPHNKLSFLISTFINIPPKCIEKINFYFSFDIFGMFTWWIDMIWMWF